MNLPEIEAKIWVILKAVNKIITLKKTENSKQKMDVFLQKFI